MAPVAVVSRVALPGSKTKTANNQAARSKKTKAVPVKTARVSRTTPKTTKPEATPAARFNITIPRKLLSSKQDGTVGIPVELGFTKANELFVGRMAMLGFASSLLGEALTGQGPLAQFDVETGINLLDTEWAVLGLIAFNMFAALAPAKGKFVPEEVEPAQAASPEGTLLNLIPAGGFGFTKANELFVGRMAQLGFAASLIGEVLTGKGALAQFGIETGLPLSDTEPLLLFFITFIFLAAINDGTGKFITDDNK